MFESLRPTYDHPRSAWHGPWAEQPLLAAERLLAKAWKISHATVTWGRGGGQPFLFYGKGKNKKCRCFSVRFAAAEQRIGQAFHLERPASSSDIYTSK